MSEQLEIEKETGQIEEWMMDALLALLKKKNYEDIRIKEISDQAQLVRCTFYRYYTSKDELLLRCCRVRARRLAERMRQENYYSFYGVSVAYFSFFLEERAFFDLLRKNDLLYFFLRSYDNLMFDVARAVKRENHEKGIEDFSQKVRFHFLYGLHGLWGIADHWLRSGCLESPVELAQYVTAFLVESYELDPDCQYYAERQIYPYDPCYIKPGNEM
ncbi:MAG: TetR/AcrR family transcriptional regulator [Firmicutes bacterium]|nr:TetR/AcrR family transcriptional regulator [Bacillota bacterium]